MAVRLNPEDNYEHIIETSPGYKMNINEFIIIIII